MVPVFSLVKFWAPEEGTLDRDILVPPMLDSNMPRSYYMYPWHLKKPQGGGAKQAQQRTTAHCRHGLLSKPATTCKVSWLERSKWH